MYKLFAGFCLLLSVSVSAQKTGGVYLPEPDAQTPDWFLPLYADEIPNVFVMDSLFDASHLNGMPEEEHRTIWEFYYQRWRRSVEPFIQADGSVAQVEVSATGTVHAKATGSWTLAGPATTHFDAADDPSQPECPWQVNVYAITADVNNPDRMLAAAETGGLFYSSNKGLAWTLALDNATTYGSVAISPGDPDLMLAGANGSLARSTDGGSSWTTMSLAAGNIHSIAFHPSDPQKVLLATDYGLFRSTDGGLSFAVTDGITSHMYDVYFHTTDPERVIAIRVQSGVIDCMRSNDAGVTFESGFAGVTPVNTSGARMSLTADDPERVYVVALGMLPSVTAPHVYRSDDGGISWELMCIGIESGLTGDDSSPLGMSNGQGFYDLDIVANPLNADEVIVASTTAYRSTNGGSSFLRLGGYGGSFNIHPDIQEMIAIDGDTWITTDGGVNYSTDFFASTANYESRTNGIFGTDFWGFSQGWNADYMAGGRYHNGNTSLSDQYPEGASIRLGGGEAGTGYAMAGREGYFAFSDIGNFQVPLSFDGPRKYFAFGMYPNEDGYGFDASDVEFLPYCYGVVFLGNGNALWRSDNLGASFTTLYDFGAGIGNKVKKFEISRSDPQTIYVATANKLNRSDDGGTSFTNLTLPTGVSTYRMDLAIDAQDPQTVWISSPSNPAGKRVYVTHDGGVSWENLTTTLIDGQGYACVVHHKGSEGGVYVLGNNGAAFYRDDTMADWTDVSDGLPAGNRPIRSFAFYRDSKIRVAGNRGVWERDLEDTYAPIAQPTVDKLVSACALDTFYFEDYSVMDHSGATWSWSFSPAPEFVSNATARNPKVVFGAEGVYDFTLNVSNAWGTDTKTETGAISISGNECGVDTVAGMAIALNGNADPADVSVPPLGITTNHLTISMWFKPDGIQTDYSSLFMLEGSDAAGFNFRPGDNKLGYHWPGGAWWWESGLIVPEGRWSHLAMVVEPDGITLYVNGEGSKHNITVSPTNLENNNVLLGSYKHWGGRYIKGEMDEVAVYDRSMSEEEIQDLMHLTRNNPHPDNLPQDDESLIAYYQFNESVGYFYNKAGGNQALPEGSAVQIASTAPVAGGTFDRVYADTEDPVVFDHTGVTLTWAEVPGTDVVVSRLHARPDVVPGDSLLPDPERYFIVRQFNGAGTASLNAISFTSIGGINDSMTAHPEYVELYNRPYYSEGDSWGDLFATADEAAGSTLAFSPAGDSWLGQFSISADAKAFAGSTALETEVAGGITLYPNPSADGWIHWRTTMNAREGYQVRITDVAGRVVRQFRVNVGLSDQEQHVLISAPGTYHLELIFTDGSRQVLPFVVAY